MNSALLGMNQEPFFEEVEAYTQTILDTAPEPLLILDTNTRIRSANRAYNEMNRDMLSRRLRRKGYVVAMALDGQSALEMSQTEAPNLILMDVGLPVLDGWEATRRLKSDPATRHIPVIALTAHAMSIDREKALEIGCDDYETKPIELPRLLAKIEGLLNTGATTSTEEPAM